jgi:hypothetical protein
LEVPAQRHPLAAVRAARGWSYQDLVEAVADRSRRLGVPMAARREKAWRWENWGVVPDADSQRALALALGVSPARMAVRPWPSWLPTGTELPADLAWSPAGSLTALRQLLADIDEDRRGFAIAAPPVLADALAAWEAPAPHRIGGPHACQHPDDADDGITAWLRTHALTLPPLLRATAGADPAVLRRKLDGDLRLIAELLNLGTTGSRTPTARPDLFHAAAKIALLAGRRCIRDALHGPAQRYLLTALRCAHSAGDPPTAATMLAIIGRHLSTLGDPPTAHRFRTLAEALRTGDQGTRLTGIAA